MWLERKTKGLSRVFLRGHILDFVSPAKPIPIEMDLLMHFHTTLMSRKPRSGFECHLVSSLSTTLAKYSMCKMVIPLIYESPLDVISTI